MLDVSHDSLSPTANPDPTPLVQHLPRERLWNHGSARITDEELLAVLLGTGSPGKPVWELAKEVVHKLGGLPAMSRSTPQELAKLSGIGSCRAMRMVAAFEMGRRAMFEPGQKRLCSPEDIVRLLTPRIAGSAQEHCFVVGIDSRNQLITEVEVARGTLMMVAVEPREVFHPLIRMSAAAAILVHNHPSGDPTPSYADVEMTIRLREVGEVLGIPLVDHIIMGGNRFCSVNEWAGTLLERCTEPA